MTDQFIASINSGADVLTASDAFASSIAEQVELAGIAPFVEKNPLAALLADGDKKVPMVARLTAIKAVAEKVSRSAEPVLLAALPSVLAAASDKEKKVVTAAEEAARAVVENVSVWAVPAIVPTLIAGCGGKAKPSQKEVCLKIIKVLAEKAPVQVGSELVTLVAAVTDFMWDIKKEVKNAAVDAMKAIVECSGNKDLVPFIPVVLEAFMVPTTVPTAVEKLAGCVFVQNVEAPALALMTPVLVKGLNERKEEVKRKCCVIIDNMCKLVDQPKEVLPLMSTLEPLLLKQVESISDPEARSIAEKAYKTLTKAGGEGAASVELMSQEKALKIFSDVMEKKCPNKPTNKGFVATLEHVAELAACLTKCNCFEVAQWTEALTSLLAKSVPESDAAAVVAAVLEKCEVSSAAEEEEDDDDEGVDMYKGTFSLAYGSLTLLNNTKLHLKRNKFYGLLGPNNCGKTTFMRATANEQIEGFPKRTELKTIFVEHEIQERVVGEDETGYDILNIDLNGVDWVVDTCNNVYEMNPPVNKEQVIDVMKDIGFGNASEGFGKDRAADCGMGVTTYSGGWKMKMQLCAATLMDADILMLDEPTGHLDIKNIAWLEGWLQAFMDKGGSIIATSHDTTFLNKMCTHIVDFQERKLKMFRGPRGSVLTEWVAKYPEKQGYFELKNDVCKFVFPKPGSLEGVKSKTKAIMKMTGVEFQYPTRDSPTVMDIGLQVSQVSRVAVIGPNGAGKSTAIKLLTGELKPSQGIIWQHPNMRLAYVAQHAFHHLEKHLNKTAAQYIMWRFAGNDDAEALEFKGETPMTNEDEERQKASWFLDPKQSYRLRKCETAADLKLAVVPETLVKRRENKKEKTKEYEVKWQFRSIEATDWVDRYTLLQMGYLKMVQRKDEQEAAAAGLQSKPLTSQAIEKHLKDFGLDSESASHSLIQALSGGQKVKVVLAASMWQNPHLVILDEPTNYLDRDGLGALTEAIKEYEGGVIIISHNREFANAVSQEKWVMEAGRLRREGESVAKEEEAAQGYVEEEEVRDASGNTINVTLQKSLSDKEKKVEMKAVEKRIKDIKKKDKKYEESEEYWENMDRLAELKGELAKK